MSDRELRRFRVTMPDGTVLLADAEVLIGPIELLDSPATQAWDMFRREGGSRSLDDPGFRGPSVFQVGPGCTVTETDRR